VTQKHHVLLIGIDAYDGGGMLTGCVNDIDAVQRVLLERVRVAPEWIQRLAAPRSDQPHDTSLPSELPTLANIRAALDRLGGDAVDDGDHVFIYYSGHGTQCVVVDGDRRYAREAILPKDKLVGPTRQFLFDWELNAALARIAQRTSRVTVILDSCSSGGATRGPLPPGAANRFFATVEPVVSGTPPTSAGVVAAAASIERCQVLAACRADQRARESPGTDGMAHGELTRAFVSQLETAASGELETLSWSRIWHALDLAVRAANPSQAPWLCGRLGRRIFGFDVDEEGDPGFAVVQVPEGFEIDAGTVHGVTEGSVVGAYAATPATFPAVGSPEDGAALRGRIRIARAELVRSVGIAVEPFGLPDAARGRVVEAGRAARLRVRVAGDDPVVHAALGASPMVEVVADAEEVALVRTATGWALVDDVFGAGADDGPVLAAIPADRSDLVGPVLAHYLEYVTPLRIARSYQGLAGALGITILDCSGAVLAGAVAQDPQLSTVNELRTDQRACFAVVNNADVALEVTLLDASGTGAVVALGAARIAAGARHVFWAGATLGVPFTLAMPEGRAMTVDRLVAIGTTSTAAALESLARRTTFADLVARPRTRSLGIVPDAPPVLDRWTATVTNCRISRA